MNQCRSPDHQSMQVPRPPGLTGTGGGRGSGCLLLASVLCAAAVEGERLFFMCRGTDGWELSAGMNEDVM